MGALSIKNYDIDNVPCFLKKKGYVRMKKRNIKNIQWSILICSLLLSIIGLIALYSATQGTNAEEFKKQLIWIIISIPIVITIIFIDYSIIARISPIFYGIFIFLLIIVLFTGSINGAKSWFDLGFFSLQPGEFAKIFVILLLSLVIVKFQEKSKKAINNPLKLGIILLIGIIPSILVALQPDYGTAIAFIVALVTILFVSGIAKKYIIICIILIVTALPLLYFFVLPEHAKSRIEVYLNPNSDPRGSGYNIIQSKIAIGAGKLMGMGWLKGTQTHLGFLYPKDTDFIYSVIGEELGFITCGSIIIIYVILITKAIHVAKTARDDLGAYIAIGIVRNAFVSHNRKYRHDNWITTNNRYTTTIY